jgi:hypothetical protein
VGYKSKVTPVLVSLAQLVWTVHNICKVRGSNPGHHQKKKSKVTPDTNKEFYFLGWAWTTYTNIFKFYFLGWAWTTYTNIFTMLNMITISKVTPDTNKEFYFLGWAWTTYTNIFKFYFLGWAWTTYTNIFTMLNMITILSKTEIL